MSSIDQYGSNGQRSGNADGGGAMVVGERRRAVVLSVVAVLHCAIALWHGSAHLAVPVPLSPLQTAFVGLVIVTLPLLATALLWTRARPGAAILYTGAMLASLLFGVINHYILVSPDNVMCVPPGAFRLRFVLSSALVAGSELIGTVLGVLAVRRWRR